MLKIPAACRAELIRVARQDSPIETCGYLSGVDNEVKEVIPLTNIDHSPEHFSFDPKEQFQVVKAARAKGYRLLAVYHSHPASPARLSQEDLRFLNDPHLFYLIVSLLNPEVPDIRAFQVAAREVSEVPILTTGE